MAQLSLSQPAVNSTASAARHRATAAYRCDIETAVHHHGVGFVVTGWMLLSAATQGFRSALMVGHSPLRGSFRYGKRPDVPAPPGMRALGFEFRLAAVDAPRLLDGPVTLMVGDGSGGATASQRLEPPRWAWSVETLGERAVTGWAADLLRPALPPVLLLRAGRALVPIAAGPARPDVELAPGVAGWGFAIDLGALPGDLPGDLPVDLPGADVPADGWIELCVGDPLNPVASLRRPQVAGREPALARLAEDRARAHRGGLDGLAGLQAKLTEIQCAPRAALARGFEPAGRAPALRAGGWRREVGGDRRAPALWLPEAAAGGLAVVAASGLALSPVLAARARRLAGRAEDAWYVPNGVRDLPGASTAEAFPLLTPRLTPRLLAQAPDYAPLLLAPAAALDGWSPADGMAALHGLLLERLGPPAPLHEALYAAAGRPALLPPDHAAARSRRRQPLVSLIVPSRDNVGHLAKLLAGAARLRRGGTNLEVVIVDNASRSDTTAAFLGWAGAADWIRVLRDRGDFNFSRLCNRGAAAARGAVLLFCNDDIEIGADFDPAAMTALLAEPGVGIVGHTLVYEDGTIQHAGVVVGAYDAADNGQTAFTLAEGGYFGLARLTREVSAVTGAFMAVRRDAFARLGGFNERDFAVNFNDVDLCLRARAEGLAVLNTCCGTVVHHESVSRAGAADRRARELVEVAALRRIWGTKGYADPYYSPGFERHALPYTRPNWLLIGLPCPDWRPPPATRPRDLPAFLPAP